MPFKDPEARKAYAAKHYKDNKAAYTERTRKTQRTLREYVYELKTNTPCTDCGKYWHYCQMQFDHTGSDKIADVQALMRSSTLVKVKAEIAKCDIVCANCHSLRTWQRASKSRSSIG